MKAAVTTENQEVFQHFGKCQTFTLAVIENNQILSKSLLDAQGNGHSALVGLLQAQGSRYISLQAASVREPLCFIGRPVFK